MDNTTPIVIFGLGRGTFHHGALGIARSGGRLGIPVFRVSPERRPPAAFSRYNSGWVSIPSGVSTDRVLELLRSQRRSNGRAVLVPIDDVSSVFVEEHADELRGDFLFPHQPSGLAQSLSSKREMYELCLKHEVPTPWSAFPESEAELLEHVRASTYPVVLKCINAGDAPPDSPRVAIVRDRDELCDKYRLMEPAEGSNVMLQEYIPGTSESVWMLNGYFDASGECKVAFTGKKIRQWPPYTGITTLGECIPNAVVEETTKRFMKAVGYAGILDIGYRFDHRDGLYKLLDVNPRIGGTFRLFVGADGMDVLRALYLDLTGQDVPASAATDGRRWVVDPLDLAASLVYRRRGDFTLGSWVRSFRGVREAAWFALDDPLPLPALWLHLLTDWLPRRVRRAVPRRAPRSG